MSGHAKTGALTVLLTVGLPAVCLLAACGPADQSEPQEVETVDVVPGRTTVLTTAYDEVAERRQEGSLGVLPSDFPQDLPLYQPASLTDFGSPEGGRYVLLFSPDEKGVVQQRMKVELRRSGWTLVEGSAERGTYRRGSQSVVLSVTDARPGTEIRVEY